MTAGEDEYGWTGSDQGKMRSGKRGTQSAIIANDELIHLILRETKFNGGEGGRDDDNDFLS